MKMRIFPNVGVSFELFKPYKKSLEDPMILYVGRFPNSSRSKWEKNPLLVLRLFEVLKKKITELRLLMIGEGPGLPKIKSHVERKGIGKSVLFKGYINYFYLPEIYSKALFTIIPTYFPEMTYFWDGSLKESLACGTPVIIFGDYFKLEEWGIMIPFKKINTSVEKLTYIFSRYDRYFTDMSYVRKLLKKYCSWESISRHLTDIYRMSLEGDF
jgi:glycosyltransferase involved in cell wall biosynthesis